MPRRKSLSDPVTSLTPRKRHRTIPPADSTTADAAVTDNDDNDDDNDDNENDDNKNDDNKNDDDVNNNHSSEAQTPSRRPRRKAASKPLPTFPALDDHERDHQRQAETPSRRRGREGTTTDGEQTTPTPTPTPKRSAANGTSTGGQSTIRKKAMRKLDDTLDTPTHRAATTPSGGRKPQAWKQDGGNAADQQPDTPSRRRPATPRTPRARIGVEAMTPRRRMAADRSARKKSMRALIERAAGDGDDDEEDAGAALARQIYESSSSEDDDDDDDDNNNNKSLSTPTTTKRSSAATATTTPRRSGRRKRSPTPPRGNLPPHERYFLDMRPGRPRTGDTTLAQLGVDLLSHDDYFSTLRADQKNKNQNQNQHTDETAWLLGLHAQSFAQWAFELAEGFGVCLYGFGSKRAVVAGFAAFLAREGERERERGRGKTTIVVVNGYVRSISPKDILASLWTALHPGQKPPATLSPHHILPTSPSPSPSSSTTTLLINSIDAPPMRRPAIQSLLTTLRPHLRLLCTADTPDFALLWDTGRRAALNLVFHDCTTFAPRAPAEMDVVDEVHELLGQRARRVGGREGVAFVLRSLPDKARRMFKLLVGEVLVAMEEEGGGGGGGGEENPGVEWRMVYNKAVEEFVCGNEMAFRTLLKEFYDHQMVVSRTDALGTEMLSVPFRKQELEAIFEDLCGEEG